MGKQPAWNGKETDWADMAIEGDFVLEHRSVMEHAVFQDDWLYRLFRWCIMKANYRPGKFRGHEIPVGSFVTGTKKGAEELGVTCSKFHRGLHKLTESPYEVIELDPKRDFTIVTICNYKTYQVRSAESETPVKRSSETQMKRFNTTDDNDLENCSGVGAKRQRNASETPAKTIEQEQPVLSLSLSKATERKFPLTGRFDTLEMHEAVSLWARHYADKRHGTTFSDIEAGLMCSHYASAGWTAERLIKAIHFSILRGSKNIIEDDGKHSSSSNSGRTSPPPAPAKPVPKRVAGGEWTR